MIQDSKPAVRPSLFDQYVGPILAMVAAFVVYYCMYGFRKPFGAASWEGTLFQTSIELKTALAVSQIIGYATAKLIGTRICSALRYDQIVFAILACMVFSLGTLFALPFAGDYKFVAMFFNGLSLGMIWGFVMRPLEGRALTEMLICGLCVSFIVASGDVKTMGRSIMDTEAFATGFGGDVAWMPFLTAMVYFPFLVAGVVALFVLPKPTVSDQKARHARESMQGHDRREFLRHHAKLLIPLGVTYFLLTAYRDYRDTFQAEIFASLNIDSASAFSTTERYVAFGVLVVVAIFIFVKNSKAALYLCHLVMALGLVFCGLTTLLLKLQWLSGFQWMIGAGLGVYVCYIAFHCIVFERMVAISRSKGNAVFAIMVFDFVGYVAAILFMLVADLFKTTNHLNALVLLTWVLTIAGGGAILFSMTQISQLEQSEANSST